MMISLIISIVYWQRIKKSNLKLLPVYTLVSLFISIPWYFNHISFPGIAIQNFFTLFEAFIFYHFYNTVLIGIHQGRLLLLLYSILIISAIIIPAISFSQSDTTNLMTWINKKIFTHLYVIESIVVVVPVLFYYRSLFNPPLSNGLANNPTFLVMSGILFCFTISIPVLAFRETMLSQNKEVLLYLYIINSFSYVIMYLFFIKAFTKLKDA